VHIDRLISGSFVRVFMLMAVVLLGIFIDVFTHGGPIHWQPAKLWNDECSRWSQCGKRLHPRPSILFIPIDVRHVLPILDRANCIVLLLNLSWVERLSEAPLDRLSFSSLSGPQSCTMRSQNGLGTPTVGSINSVVLILPAAVSPS
jgi:hypothetical protein